MNASTRRCELCGGAAEPLDPLVPEEFYPGIQLHLHCLNSAAGLNWTRTRAEADPSYARYLALITIGRQVNCSACGASERLSPKASAMGAGHWEASCRSCHWNGLRINAYRGATERELYGALSALAHEFKLSSDPAEILARVERLALEADPLLPGDNCSCGDRFSLAARPRCSSCGEVLLDSPFHITLPPAASVGEA